MFNYRLGNRSAREWVVDHYRVARDVRGEIASDPNRQDNEFYFVRLLDHGITVSLETLAIVHRLPGVRFGIAHP